MKEKRQYKRFPVDLDLKYTLILDDLSGKIKNISQGGFLFTTSEKIDVPSFLSIEFKMNKKKINSYVKVVWTKELADNKYDVGAKFVDIDGAMFDKELSEFIKTLED